MTPRSTALSLLHNKTRVHRRNLADFVSRAVTLSGPTGGPGSCGLRSPGQCRFGDTKGELPADLERESAAVGEARTLCPVTSVGAKLRAVGAAVEGGPDWPLVLIRNPVVPVPRGDEIAGARAAPAAMSLVSVRPWDADQATGRLESSMAAGALSFRWRETTVQEISNEC